MEGIEKLRHRHPLSDIDLSMAREYVSLILVFDFPDIADAVVREAIACIHHGLLAALCRFPFLAGKLGPDHARPNGVQVRYPDIDDISLVGGIFTFSTCKPCHSFQELCTKGMPGTYLIGLGRDPISPQDEPDQGWSAAFKLHATFIKTGGLFLEFEFQHNLVDGSSMYLFIKSFASAVKGQLSREKQVPYKAPDLPHLYGLPAPPQTEEFAEWDFSSEKPVSPNSGHTLNRIFTLPASKVRVLKQDIERHIRFGQNTEWVSSTDCVSAIIWSAITAARSTRLPLGKPTRFATAVGLRSKLEPPLPSPYFGNMAIVAVAQSTVGELLGVRQPLNGVVPRLYSGCFAQVALQIRRAITAVDAEYGRQRLLKLSQLDDPQEARLASARALNFPETGVRVGSLATFGADLDFGIPGTREDGTPSYIRKPWMGGEGNVVILPRKGGTKGDADWEILVALSRTDMVGLEALLKPWCSRISEEHDGPSNVD